MSEDASVRDQRSFAKISSVDIDEPDTWRGKIFLSFDVDWAHDEVLFDTLELVRQAKVPATWFVTHRTPFLDSLDTDAFEVGIHPNFSPLLEGSGTGGGAAAVLDELLELVPGARAIRSHCLVRSSRLESLFAQRGLTHESNDLIPAASGIKLRPYRKLTPITQVPYCWADEASWVGPQSDDFPEVLAQTELLVLDFHPIHVFLNTESADRYERTREIHQRPDELIEHRYQGTGTRTRLKRLLGLPTSGS